MTNRATVLYISYNGLLEPIVPSQAIPYLDGLARKGYRIILLTFEKKKDLQRVGHEGVRRMQDELAACGIEWRHLAYHKNPRLVATVYDLFIGSVHCFYLIWSRKVRIVHVRGITPGSIMLFLRGLVRVRVLFDMRGLLAEEIAAGGGWEEGGVSFKLIKKAEEGLLKRADAIAVLTHKHLALNRGLEILKERNVPMDAIPCCVDLGKFCRDSVRAVAFREKLMLSETFILMYQGKIGTFYFMREMVDFFESMAGVRADSLFFVVTNDSIDPVKERVAAAGLGSERMRSAHGVAFADMPRYLEMADAGIFFINPRNKLGSSPIKMGEFLASGVPVIINPGIGDTEELVRDNNVGVIVKDFTRDAYETAVNELFRLKRDGEALRARCRETARRFLSLEDGIERYAGLYEKLAGGAR